MVAKQDSNYMNNFDELKKIDISCGKIESETSRINCEIEINFIDKMSKSDFAIEKLSGSENYHDWCFAISNYLTMKGLKKCITGKLSANNIASDTVAAEEDGDKLDQAQSCLALSVEKGLYVHIRDCTSALQIWNKFKKLYEDRGLQRKIGLLRSLISYRLEESDGMQAYIEGIMTTSSKLSCIGFELADEWISAIMLAGLPEEFKPFIMSLEANSKTPTSDEIKLKLLDSQDRSNGQSGSSAFFGKKKGEWKGRQQRRRKCFVCESTQHLAKNCDQKRDDSNTNENSRESEKAESANFAWITLTASDLNDDDLVQVNDHALSAEQSVQKNEWYVDSGASNHMTAHESILRSVKRVSNVSANKGKMKVEKTGNTTLRIDDNKINVT